MTRLIRSVVLACTLSVTAAISSGCNSNSTLPSADIVITAPAQVTAGTTGLAASIPLQGSGYGLSWTIDGGTITSGTTQDAIVFTAGSGSSLELSVTAAAQGSTVTASTEVLVAPIPLSPTIDLPASAAPGAEGVLARVDSPQAGVTYAWTITGGTLLQNSGDSVQLNVASSAAAGQTVTVSCVASNAAGASATTATAKLTVVTPPGAASLRLTFPAEVTSGSQNLMIVGALDSTGSVVTSYTGTVTFTATDPLAQLPLAYTFTAADKGQHSFNTVVLSTVGSQTISAVDDSTPPVSGTTPTIGVSAVQTTPSMQGSLTLTGPASAQAGSPLSYTVTALNGSGGTNVNYRGTVSLYSTDPKLPAVVAQHVFTASDAGVFVFTGIAFAKAQPTILAATDGSAYASVAVAVSAGPAQSLAVTGFPAQVSSGTLNSVTVTLYDSAGNVAVGYVGTIAFTSTNPKATLPPNTIFTAGDMGIHLFSNVALGTASESTTYSITATDTAQSALSGSESGIVVFPGAVNSLGLSGIPLSMTAGDSNSLVIHLFDAAGNLASNFSGALSITTSDTSTIAVPASGTALTIQATAANGGVVVVTPPIRLVTPSSQAHVDVKLASSTVTASVTPIVVTPGVESSFKLTGPTTAQAGVPLSYTVSAVDALGNTDTAYTGTVSLFSTDPQLSAVTPHIFVATDMGSYTFSNIIFKTVQVTTLNASDSKYSNSISVTVTPGPISSFSFDGLPPPGSPISPPDYYSYQVYITAGNPLGYTFTLTARDQYNNVATNYTGTAHFTSNDPGAVLPGDTSFAGANGVVGLPDAGLPFALYQTGQNEIIATDLNPPAMTSAAFGETYITTCPIPYAPSFYYTDYVFSDYSPSAVVDNPQSYVGYTWSFANGATAGNGAYLNNGSYPLSVIFNVGDSSGTLSAYGTNYAGDVGPSASIDVNVQTMDTGMMLLAGTPGGVGNYQAAGSAGRIPSTSFAISDNNGGYYVGYYGYDTNYADVTPAGAFEPTAYIPCSGAMVSSSPNSFYCVGSQYLSDGGPGPQESGLTLVHATYSGSDWTDTTALSFGLSLPPPLADGGVTTSFPYQSYRRSIAETPDGGTIFVADYTSQSIQIAKAGSGGSWTPGPEAIPYPALAISAVDDNTVFAILYQATSTATGTTVTYPLVRLTQDTGTNQWISSGPLVPTSFSQQFPFITALDANTVFTTTSSQSLYKISAASPLWTTESVLDNPQGFADVELMPQIPDAPAQLLAVNGASLQLVTVSTDGGAYQPQIVAGDITHTSGIDPAGLASTVQPTGTFAVVGSNDVYELGYYYGGVYDIGLGTGQLASQTQLFYNYNNSNGSIAVIDSRNVIIEDVTYPPNPDGGVNLSVCNVAVENGGNYDWTVSTEIPFPDCSADLGVTNSPVYLAVASSQYVLAAFKNSVYLVALNSQTPVGSPLFTEASINNFQSIQTLDASHYVLLDDSGNLWALSNPLSNPTLQQTDIGGYYVDFSPGLMTPIGGTSSFYEVTYNTYYQGETYDNLGIYRLDAFDENDAGVTGDAVIAHWYGTQVLANTNQGNVFKPGPTGIYQLNQPSQAVLLPPLSDGTEQMLLFDSAEYTLGLLRFVEQPGSGDTDSVRRRTP